MNQKLDHITRLFQRCSKKRIENYVLTRLWHKLDDDSIKMLPQQYVARGTKNYALTDVYLPQLKLHVEVNESAHYDSEENIKRDERRVLEIEQKTGHQVVIIDCRHDLANIHEQIDSLIDRIKSKVETLRQIGDFVEWNPNQEFNPDYWKSKGIIDAKDEVSMRTIEDICLLFDIDPNKTKRGFLRQGAVNHPSGQCVIWWPSAKSRSGWINIYDEQAGIITESHGNLDQTVKHYLNHTKMDLIRYVFFHNKDILGFSNYQFIGVFKNDFERSNEIKGVVWTKVREKIELYASL